MSQALEIEKKYLVKFPKSWSDLAELFEDLIDVNRISQTYLKAEDNEPSARVRKTVKGLTGDTECVYHYNKKKFIEKGVHDEFEKEISKSEYERQLKNCHKDKTSVEKTRFIFKYKNHEFELDVFKGALKGLAILELELNDKKQKINLPPFLKVIKEVTDNDKYSNYYLADKKLHKKANNNEFEKAIKHMFWDNVPQKALDIIENNAISVMNMISKVKWNWQDCENISKIWNKIFEKAGINSQIIQGYYWEDYDPNIEAPLSRDHFWIEIDGGVFDPTASQFGNDISKKNYYVFDELSKAYNALSNRY